ncbi:MAG: SPOR domain-containing protein [Dysgonomonas sp.]|nr:SPOR domain-containing protein [Dysgonomonas sp.]
MNKYLGFGLALSLLVAFGSCKPKQSAYKSVYEAAKERELEENRTQQAATPSTPTYPAYTSNVENEPVRTEKITPVYEADAAGLRAYSVVIASLSVKPNAEALKTRMEQEGYKVILAQNAQGMYRVIIGSFDDKVSAVNERNAIRDRYLSTGSSDDLRRTYGIPFDDLWILQRQY